MADEADPHGIPRPGPRPGYNRDEVYTKVEGQPESSDFDPIIVNWPLVGRAIAAAGALGGFLVPASIIIWRIAL